LHPLRKQRIYAITAVLIGTSVALILVLNALSKNMNLFYSPTEIIEGVVKTDSLIRAGGMVKEGSIIKSSNSLEVSFVITDFKNSVIVVYEGILPDLFAENAGVVVQGRLGVDGNFLASEVLAKHDENYMPPEVYKILEKQNDS
jgi:cytochrome c-type biogenesis protein CcmE|tara:strand:+ start:7436 stop:7867 length:432 start_codon:yes stop_codon:yes gene_type:complete